MKTCLSEGKLMKQFGPPPILREPPFQITPLFLSNFFMTPLFVQILKTRNPPDFRGDHEVIMHGVKEALKINFMKISWKLVYYIQVFNLPHR